MKKFRLGLVLGGGGARGLSHIGVLKVLEKEGIIPDHIVGTSMGALVGAWFAISSSAIKTEEIARNFIETKDFIEMQSLFSIGEFKGTNIRILNKLVNNVKDFIVLNLGLFRNSLLQEALVKKIVYNSLSKKTFSELKIPLACIATDLSNGEKIVFDKGDLKIAVLASISIPGIFPPVLWDSKYLCDGAVVSNTPVLVAKEKGSNYILAVEVKDIIKKIEKIPSGIEIIFRSQNIGLETLQNEELKYADYVLHPEIKNIHWSNFKKIDFIIKKGEEEAIKHIKQIKKDIKKKRFLNYFKLY